MARRRVSGLGVSLMGATLKGVGQKESQTNKSFNKKNWIIRLIQNVLAGFSSNDVWVTNIGAAGFSKKQLQG